MLPQIDESSITDEKKFLVDTIQCIDRARTGESASGTDYAQNAGMGAGIGGGSGVAFGAMTGGVSGAGAAVEAVVGVLSGGGRSVDRTAQPNDQIYSQCMVERGYKILQKIEF